MSNRTVVFFGNEKLATGIPDPEGLIKQAVLDAGFEIEQVITGKLDTLKPHKSELAVLAAYGKIIPQKILNEFPLGIVNIHPSLLPAYRGPTPIEQAILDGVTKTGVSIMKLSAGMDEGPLYKQKTVHLRGDESKEELVCLLQTVGAELIKEALPRIADGTLLPRSQPHPDRATYSHKITKENGSIDWAKPADVIEREIRAFSAWPKSRTTLGGKDVIITKAHAASGVPVDSNPGDIDIVEQTSEFGVVTGNGTLWIDKLQPAGKKEMDVQAFLAGYRHLLG